ncbi:MAG: 2Fe-2S iron-sulfur cluster-binding protein [Sphaerochaetaceae bacterium]|nr:2Fe-2S iron-sulfur cluster-binding protein [Sphaerochaetaceae bacterium]
MAAQINTYTIFIKRNENETLKFVLDLDNSLTVIDALEEIRFKFDSTITYRHSCHHGSCGTCACLINGEEKLACMTFLSEFKDFVINIEPLRNFEIISDLVIDISKMINHMPLDSYIKESEINKDSIKPTGIFKWTRFENCIECGSCISACPVTDNFIGPSPLAAINRKINKSTDEETIKELKKIAFSENGVEKCDKQYKCSKVCPTRVSPGKHINDLRKIKDN